MLLFSQIMMHAPTHTYIHLHETRGYSILSQCRCPKWLIHGSLLSLDKTLSKDVYILPLCQLFSQALVHMQACYMILEIGYSILCRCLYRCSKRLLVHFLFLIKTVSEDVQFLPLSHLFPGHWCKHTCCMIHEVD